LPPLARSGQFSRSFHRVIENLNVHARRKSVRTVAEWQLPALVRTQTIAGQPVVENFAALHTEQLTGQPHALLAT
jgi:hypothetical protein